MAQVERDLKAGRYQNALRQRRVLVDGLGQRQAVPRRRVRGPQDATANLPDRHPEGNPRQHARPLARRLGGTQPPVLRAAVRYGSRETRREMKLERSVYDGKRAKRENGNCWGSAATHAICRPNAAWVSYSPNLLRLSPLSLFSFLHVPRFLSSAAALSFAADAQKVVIPFDFVSKFDDGRYGQIVGDMLWKKLSREGGFIIPESMLDVRDYCASHKLKPSPEMDLEKMKKIVRDDFDAQIGIWGSVERAPGQRRGNLRSGDQVRRLFGAAEAQGDLRRQGQNQFGQRDSAPVRQADVRRALRAAAGRRRRGQTSIGRRELEEEPEPRGRRFRARQRRRAEGLGAGWRPAARAAGQAGPLDGRGGQSRQPASSASRSTKWSPKTKA